MRSILRAAISALAVCVTAAPALAANTPLWNGYRWARSGPLAIKLGDNVGSAWDGLLRVAASDWSAGVTNADFTVVGGTTSAASCNPVYATVQACNYNYGATGWLGLASIWLTNGYISQGTVKLNEYYYSQPRYNTIGWRQFVTCQEVGHTLGLAHADENFSNANLGTCMDYTNDPTGTRGTNGTLANLHPYGGDFAALNGLYATPGGSQLPGTRPTLLAVHGFGIDGEEFDFLSAIPEPASWAMMIGGFGLAGTSLRRRRRRRRVVPA